MSNKFAIVARLSKGTERRGRVANTPYSYSGGPRFKYRPRDQLRWLKMSWYSSGPPRKYLESNSN
jgi:hypothetical protein